MRVYSFEVMMLLNVFVLGGTCVNKNNWFDMLKRKLIGDRTFYAQMIAIVIPIIIQNTVTNVVSLLDNVMVGRVGTLEMSAVAIVNQLLFVFNVCIFGGLSGAGIFATQYAGAMDDEGIRHCFRIKWMIVLGMMAFALAVFLAIPKQLIGFYLSSDADATEIAKTLGFGMDYLMVMIWGLLPFAVAQVYASTLREIGETKLPMMASVIGILTNLVFNYLLIFGKFGFPRMGVTGAAVATVLSRYVEAAIIMVYTHAQSMHFSFIRGAYRSMHIPGNLLGAVGKKGMPLLVNEFFWSIGIAFLMQCYSVRGLDVVAATNIASTVSNLFKVVFMSMGSAVAIMVGQALGANEGEKAKDTAWKLMAAAVASNVVMAALLAILSPVIPMIYNTEQEVRDIAQRMLLIVAIMMPFYSFCHCCYFTLRSGGRTIITSIFDSGYTWCVAAPVAYVLAYLTSMPIVPLYFCVQGVEIIKCIMGYIMVDKGIWIRNIVVNRGTEDVSC